MKKKILSLGLISILIIMLLILTGCTNGETNEVNQNTAANQNDANQEESIELEIVTASDEDDLILFREKYTYNYYITTLSGKVLAKNLKFSNSIFEIQNGFINAFNGNIYDKTGNLMYSSSNKSN